MVYVNTPMYYTYVLHSEKDGKLYTGYSPDLKNRMKAHENGYVRSTKYRRPLRLIHYEAFLFDEDAKKREQYLKGGNGKKELETLLQKYFTRFKWDK